jgi:hypothetical protein
MVVIQWEFINMVIKMVSPKKVVKFILQLTLINSNVVIFNSALIAHLAEVVGQ